MSTGSEDMVNRLNWLRAAVLGANDGIVSVAAVVLGVAGATTHPMALLLAGLAALIGGASSMALGEYVSVSSQRDAQRAHPDYAAMADMVYANPLAAAGASAVAFLTGGVVPLLAILLLPEAVKVPITVVIVLIVLALTGAISARLGKTGATRAIIRVVIGGALALGITYGIGHLLNTTGIVR